MRLIELTDRVKSTRVPAKIYHELMAQEVDTVDADSPEAKVRLADEMQRAEQVGKGYKIPFSTDTHEYLFRRALPNMIDIARDNMDNGLARTLKSFQAKLAAKLSGE